MSQYKNALVSVVIITHNRQDLLPRAIESVLVQTYSNIEIIIVDDGSKDNTPSIACKFVKEHPNKIRYFRHEVAKGACAARNTGIFNAKGLFYLGLDDDDYFTSKRVEELVNVYHPKYAFVNGLMKFAGQRIAIGQIIRKLKGKNIITTEQMLYKNVCPAFPLIELSRIRDLGGFDVKLTAAQDYDMWLRLLTNNGNKALLIGNFTYIVNVEHGYKRISTSKRSKIGGRFMFYNKHKSSMNKSQRRYQLLRLLMLKNENITFWKLLSWTPRNYLVKELFNYIKRCKYK